MAALSHDLANVILPHDQLGLHLYVIGVTIDAELEKQNLLSAAEALVTIW